MSGRTSPGADSGAGEVDARNDGPANPAPSPCAHYYDSWYLRCANPVRPADEVARVRARFEQVCQNQIALPGSGVALAGLEACASALDSSPCDGKGGLPPVECSFAGSLPGGAACTDGVQCQSSLCGGRASIAKQGSPTPMTCGTCVPLVAIGQVCGYDTFSAGCPPEALCSLTSDPTAPGPGTYTCTAITRGGIGSKCDHENLLCKTGLSCWAATGMCEITVGAISCAATGSCMPVTWVAPGQPCDQYRTLTRCLVGECGFPDLPPPLSVDGSVPWSTCPALIPDGQPCAIGVSNTVPVPTCETFSECFNGICTLQDSVVCR